MIVLDAGVVIALLDPADAHHERADAVIADLNSAPFVMHRINLAEALVGPARQGRADDAWFGLAAVGVQLAEFGDDEPRLLARLRAEYQLKMPEICALATALRLDAPLCTFDLRLAKTWESAAGRR